MPDHESWQHHIVDRFLHSAQEDTPQYAAYGNQRGGNPVNGNDLNSLVHHVDTAFHSTPDADIEHLYHVPGEGYVARKPE